MIQGKVWGQTESLLSNPTLELHRIQYKNNHECSMHCHKHKYNAFYCVSGKLKIVVKKNDYNLTDETILNPGDLCVVPPGEYHKFVGLEDGEALELYWAASLEPSDIVRENVGGKIGSPEYYSDQQVLGSPYGRVI